MSFLQCKALDVPVESLGVACIASASDHWFSIKSQLPKDAEFVQAVQLIDKGVLRMYFYHESFPQVDSIEKVPLLPKVEFQAAERGGE